MSSLVVPSCAKSLLLRGARRVPVGVDRAGNVPKQDLDVVVDVRITDGVVREIGKGLRNQGEEEVNLEGRFLLPGLWDRHVHWGQWAATLQRVDMSGTASAAAALDRIGAALRELPDDGYAVIGFGHRSAAWPDVPTVAALDAVTGGRAVVLISGDAHHGWFNSAALRRLNLPPREGIIAEREWFDLLPSLGDITGPPDQEKAFAKAARDGVVGIGDMEFGAPFAHWPERYEASRRRLKVRACTYPEHLDRAIEAGLRSGDLIEGCEGMVLMGPLKVISDGSLNTRTAYCNQPYLDAATLDEPRGVVNFPRAELTELLRRASADGLHAAVHAIGDAAVSEAIDAIIDSRIHIANGRGGASIEHAQLIEYADLKRMAEHDIIASMQPAHLLDDRDVTTICWGDREERCFLTGSMLRGGIEVALGSDAPVAALDPWLAMAAAVFRSADERDAWNAEEQITPAQAFACSTDNWGTVGIGSPGDVIAMDVNPLLSTGDARADAEALRKMGADGPQGGVALTVVAGRVTHQGY